MKIIILQDIAYRFPENELAQYHGAIWAEELISRGHAATKMVIGDPATTRPRSPLLSVSTIKQRKDPAFWAAQKADIILYYVPTNYLGCDILKAIKQGSPRTMLVARIEGSRGPQIPSFSSFLNSFLGFYIRHRHCHVERHDHATLSPPAACAYAAASTIHRYVHSNESVYCGIAHWADFITHSTDLAVLEETSFLRHFGQENCISKIVKMGYPIRSGFPSGLQGKTPFSMISIANWKPVKDPELTAKAVASVLRDNPDATYTVIGKNSDDVTSVLQKLVPMAMNRVTTMDQISNKEIVRYLSSAQVFVCTSWTEGYCSACVEALCCGCSMALTSGHNLICFKDFVANGCGTQARTRRVSDMAAAIHHELDVWAKNPSRGIQISDCWKTSLAPVLCDQLLDLHSLHCNCKVYV